MSLYGDLKPPTSNNINNNGSSNVNLNRNEDNKDGSNWSKLLTEKNENTNDLTDLEPKPINIISKEPVVKLATKPIEKPKVETIDKSGQTNNFAKVTPRTTIIPPGFAPNSIKRPKPVQKSRVMIPGAVPITENPAPNVVKLELQPKPSQPEPSASKASTVNVPKFREYDPNRPNIYSVLKEIKLKEKRKKWKEKQYALRRAQRDRSSSYSRSPSPNEERYSWDRSPSRSRSISRDRSESYSRDSYRSYNRSRSGSSEVYSRPSFARNDYSPQHDPSPPKLNQTESFKAVSPRPEIEDREESPEGLPFNDSSSIPSDDMDGAPYQPAELPPPAANVDLDLTGEEAYLRRAQMSGIIVPPAAVKNIDLFDSNVIVLANMVGPGEVDDLLEHETAQECSKFGKVRRCLVFEVPNGKLPAHESVRIYVEFEHAQSAQIAVTELNGRFFGGRKVKVQFFDPVRFSKFDLFPTPEELGN